MSLADNWTGDEAMKAHLDKHGVFEAAEAELMLQDGFVVRPGDTLIVRYDPKLTMQQVAGIKEQIESRLPGVSVLVLGCDGLAVYRPDGTAQS